VSHLTCQHGVPALIDYVEDVLPIDVRRTVDEHVAGCAKCAAFIESYLATPRLVREATDVVVPAGLGPSLLAFLRTHRP
jgi:anti-sigma factor RsiW